MSNSGSHGAVHAYGHRVWGVSDRHVGVRAAAAWAARALLTWQARAAERTHLSRLDRRLLADMGMTRADAAHEANKPFWRA